LLFCEEILLGVVKYRQFFAKWRLKGDWLLGKPVRVDGSESLYDLMEAKNPETKANSTRNLAKPKLTPNPYCGN
jgi:hypothetical protein